LFNQIARFGVPVFIFLSGWGLTISKSYERAENYFDFLKKRLANILPAYLTWNIIYLLYKFFILEETTPLLEVVRGVIRGTHFPHLYFVPLIVLFYIAYPLLLKVGIKHSGMLLSLLITVYSLLATWGYSIEGFTRNHNPFNWLFYFVFGIWIAKYSSRFKGRLNRTWVIFFLLLSLAIVIWEPLELTEEILLTQTRPSVIFYSVMVIFFFMVLPVKDTAYEKGLIEFSDYSYQIYLSHYLFIYLYRELFPDLHTLLAAVLVLILSISLAKLVEKIQSALNPTDSP
jgi:peptidoglycan/LPS O-acetylase OafA/YrhL